MSKNEILKILGFSSMIIFGFVEFSYRIWNWTEKDNGLTVLYAVIFLIILFIIPVIFKSYKEWIKEHQKKQQEE